MKRMKIRTKEEEERENGRHLTGLEPSHPGEKKEKVTSCSGQGLLTDLICF